MSSASASAWLAASRLRASAVILALSLAIAVTAMVISPPQGSADVPRATGLALSAGVLSLVVYGLAGRWKHGSRVRLERLALGYQLLAGLIVSLTEVLFTYNADATVRGVSWVCLWIVLFPVVVPMRRRRALIGALGTACSGALALWVARASGFAEAPLQTDIYLLLPNFLAAGIALILHRIVGGLRARVDRAEAMGAYQLESPIGAGSMGEVWRASHRLLARPAAIKVIRRRSMAAGELPTHHRGPDQEEDFEREAQALARLSSPHTVQLYDFGRTASGEPYYAMELLDGSDLQRLVNGHGPLPPARAVHFLKQACRSLIEAHDAGFVHRDIKPANLFACVLGGRHDRLKVLDFGLVALGDAEGPFVGTPAYAPPEGSASAAADLYSLGAVAYFLLTGSAPFEKASMPAMALAHRNETPKAPSSRREGISAALDAIVLDCLKKAPSERPASAAALLKRLEALELTWSDEDARAAHPSR
ncbi:MAG: serine/threonine-protein kinase [Myxococcota bacterium]